MTQSERLLDYMQRNPQGLTAMDALNLLGIARASARVLDLRQAGHRIISERETVKNRFGEPCTVARYRLQGED